MSKAGNDTRVMWAVAILAGLLAGGWWWSSSKEKQLQQEALMADQKRDMQVAGAVIDEGLEMLRVREDLRPFYQYNALYSPPDVIALSDPLVVSPLASIEDERIDAFFQIDPGGKVRTPYDIDDTVSEKTTAVIKRLTHEEFNDLRELARVAPEREQQIEREVLARLQKEDQKAARAYRRAQLKRARAQARTTQVAQNQKQRRNTTSQEPQQENAPRVAQNRKARRNTNAPSQLSQQVQTQGVQPSKLSQSSGSNNYTVSLDQRAKQLYSDIKQNVSSGSALNTRSAPRITRQNVSEKPSKLASKKISTAPQQQKISIKPYKPKRTKQDTEALLEKERTLPQGPSATVLYTRMSYARINGELVLYRAVTHEGITSVQGAFLNQEHLKNEWVPQTMARHSQRSIPTRLLSEEDAKTQCTLSSKVHGVFDALHFCIGDAALMNTKPAYENVALIFVMSLIGLLLLTLARSQKRARELYERRSAFIASVSHELRTPLTTLRMNSEMLRDKLVSKKNEERFLNTMVGESVRLSNLVENVLEVARFDQAMRPLHKSDVSLNQVVTDIANALKAFADDREATLITDVPADLVVHADRASLEQILMNLTENAIKYGKGKGEHRVQIIAKRQGAKVLIDVVDQGFGIAKKDRKRVFERFVRAREVGDTVVGTGLGLSLVKDLCEAQGASVEILDVDTGTCVRVTFG